MPADSLFPSLILPSRLIELQGNRLLVRADLGALFDLNGHTLTANLLSTGFGMVWVMGPGTVDGEVDITVADGKFIALAFTATSVSVFASGNNEDIPLLVNEQTLTNPEKAQVHENLSLVPGTDIASLVAGKIPAGQLPPLSLTETLSVANAAARLLLTSAQAQGKIVIEADTGKSYGLITGGTPATSGDWIQVGDRDVQIGDVGGLQAALDGKETPAGVAAQIATAQNTRLPGRGIPITSVVFTGDSITATAIPTDAHEVVYPILSLLISERNIPNISDAVGGGWNFAASGNTSTHWISTQIPRVTALVTKPSHCVINIGTNDAQTTAPVSTFTTNIHNGVTALRAANIEPIIMAITPSPTNTNTYWLSARYNRELANYCALNQIVFIDTRNDVASDTIEGLEISGSLSDPGATGGLHPKSQMQYQFAQALGRVFGQNVSPSIPTVWSQGAAINGFPNWSASTGLGNFPATNTTGPATLVGRVDGVTGNLLRLTIANNGTKNIGTGNAGIAFTAAAGVSQQDYDVYFRRDFNFANGGNPFIRVVTEKFTGRRIIMVWLETASFVVSTQAGALITALNANPQVAALCTAASMGTPGSTVATFGSTFDQHTFNTATPGSDEVGLTSGRRVRGVMEMWNPGGAQCLGLQLLNTTGTGAFGVRAQVRVINSNSGFSSVPIPSGKVVIATPWFTVTDHRRFILSAYIGGANGVYDIGRTWVQMENI